MIQPKDKYIQQAFLNQAETIFHHANHSSRAYVHWRMCKGLDKYH